MIARCSLLGAATLCLFASAGISQAQIRSLVKFSEIPERLDNYFIDADGYGDQRVFFYTLKYGAKVIAPDDTTAVHDCHCLWISAPSQRMNFSLNEMTTLKSPDAIRSIMFRWKGKEKGKSYVDHGKGTSPVTSEIEPDPETGERAEKGAYVKVQREVDPYGMPLTSAISVNSRSNHIHRVIPVFKSKMIFERQEEIKPGVIQSVWKNIIHQKGFPQVTTMVTFDDASGGMPVQFEHFSVDANRKRTSEFYSITTTRWKEIKEGQWVPVSIKGSTQSANTSIEVALEYTILTPEQSALFIKSVDWEPLFENNKGPWFEEVTEKWGAFQKEHGLGMKEPAKEKKR